MKDSYGREINYMRVSVTERCNLRCRYCMPENGIEKLRHSDMLTEEELIAIIKEAANIGIKKIRFTGGEPLIKKNILSIIEKTSKIDGISEIALTTNGILLPDMASDLRKAGVSRVNLSLDTLSEEKYQNITRIGTLYQALEGLEAAILAGFEKVKINTVLIGGFNTDEIGAMTELTRKYDLDLRFIELMPINNQSEFGAEAFVPASIVLQKLPGLKMLGREGVADLYGLAGAKGRIGLISPVSCSFCNECNRLRLTADGRLLPCLHSSLSYHLKGLPEPQIRAVLSEAIMAKPREHDRLSAFDASHQPRTMNKIGG